MSANGANPATSNYTYDNEGRIQTSVTTSGGNTYKNVYTYSDGTIIISGSNGSTLTSQDSIRHNDAGMITYIRTYYYPGTTYSERTYTYNSAGEVLKTVSSNNNSAAPDPNPPLTTTTHTYKDGNYAASSTGEELEYYTDKAERPGSYLHLFQFVNYGSEAKIFKATKMLKAVKTASSIINFNYTYDNEDKVTQMRVTQDTTIIDYSYQYQCD
jgi:hypothetical protein